MKFKSSAYSKITNLEDIYSYIKKKIMSTLSLNKTNRFSINNIKKNMSVTLRKKMSKRYFDLSIKNLNDSAPIHRNDQWAQRLGLKKKNIPGFAVTNFFKINWNVFARKRLCNNECRF